FPRGLARGPERARTARIRRPGPAEVGEVDVPAEAGAASAAEAPTSTAAKVPAIRAERLNPIISPLRIFGGVCSYLM
ncbi:hypothetical protein, partial [Streptomyces aureus]